MKLLDIILKCFLLLSCIVSLVFVCILGGIGGLGTVLVTLGTILLPIVLLTIVVFVLNRK